MSFTMEKREGRCTGCSPCRPKGCDGCDMKHECPNRVYRTVRIGAMHYAGPNDVFVLPITIFCLKDTMDCMQAIRDAAEEFLSTDDGKKCLEENGAFNYGDFVNEVPEEICRRHGFAIDVGDPISEIVDHNESLIPD